MRLSHPDELPELHAVPSITEGQGKTLSRPQLLFNRFSLKLSQAKQELQALQQKLSWAMQFYYTQLLPLQKQEAQSSIRLCDTLTEYCLENNVSQKTEEAFRKIAVQLLAFRHLADYPKEQISELLEIWTGKSLEKTLLEEQKALRLSLEDKYLYFFGEEIDLSELFLKEGEVAQDHFWKMVRDKVEQLQAQAQRRTGRKKVAENKKPKEIGVKKADADFRRSLRSIYIRLSKILHPDTCQEETEKAVKESLMKALSVAYEKKDLFRLLQLDIEHCGQQELQGNMAEQKLRQYTMALKKDYDQCIEQLKELEQSREFHQYKDFMPGYAKEKPETLLQKLQKSIEEVENAIALCQSTIRPKDLLEKLKNIA